MQQNSKGITTKKICFMAALIALSFVLSYVSGRVGTLIKVSLNFIAVYVGARAFGPLAGGILGAVGDVFSFFTGPGGFLPQLTAIEAVYGFLIGVVFYQKSNKRLTYSKLNLKIAGYCSIQFMINITLKTFILMSKGYAPNNFIVAAGTRLLSCAVIVILHFIVINLLERYMPRLVSMIRK